MHRDEPRSANDPNPAERSSLGDQGHVFTLQKDIRAVKGRIVREATSAVGMLEAAIDALLAVDEDAALSVIRRDDEIDREEVAIEEECLRVLALFNPVARDFRTLICLMRVNADLERVADHAVSLCKLTIRLRRLGGLSRFPLSVQELGHRVPMLCQSLLSALINDNVEGARNVLLRDETIDSLDKRVFEEALDALGESREANARALLLYRCGREMERVGDLMTNIAEDVIYLNTGQIVRHAEKKRLRSQNRG
jgi:phosphate transport system protein